MKLLLIFLLLFNTLAISLTKSVKKNVVIIVADDLGFNDASFRGSNELSTFNIDALAYSGIVLNRFYTAPVCTPSRSAFLTGKYPHRNGMQNHVIVSDEPWGLGLDEKLMSEYFKESGYATHLVGKWHLGFFQEKYMPTYRGFDTFFGYNGPYIDYFDYTLKMFSRNYSRGYDLRRDLEVDRSYSNVYATDMFTTETVKIIENHDKEKPLFLFVSHLAPHSGNDDFPLQAKEEDLEKFSFIENKDRRTLAAMIHGLDKSVGDIFEALQRTGLMNDTIVVFFSDNGGPSAFLHATTASNYPLRGQKQSGWEGATRTNAIIYAPFLPSGVVRNNFFYIADFLPTLGKLSGANFKIKRSIDGMNLSNMIKWKLPPYRDEIVVVDDVFGYSSYIRGGLKYVNGSSSNGEADGWLGSNNNTEVGSLHYIDNVLNSKVARVIGQKLNARKINEVRSKATVRCKNEKPSSCDLMKGPCLFDIVNDECERVNLAGRNKVLINLWRILFENKMKSLVKSHRKPPDPRCDPVNFNYTWHWWEDSA